jgi:hypothetical protein
MDGRDNLADCCRHAASQRIARAQSPALNTGGKGADIEKEAEHRGPGPSVSLQRVRNVVPYGSVTFVNFACA